MRSDLCGHIPLVSFLGFKYFLTMIDDYSECSWIYFIKHKSEVFDMFLAYKSLVKKDYIHHILKFRSDSGGEYVNKYTTFIEQGIQMKSIFFVYTMTKWCS